MGVFKHVITISLATATSLCISGISNASAQEEITFQQVLNNPSDQQLNITYAQQRVEAGDLLAAAATLERLLIDEPNWDEARLLYASVLFQLGDYTAAKREADLLEGRDFSADTLAEVERYRTASNEKTQRTRISGRVSAGLGYDENAGSQLAEDGLTIESVDQFSLVLRGRAKVEHDLSDTSELRLFGEGDAYFKQFEDDEFSEFLIASARAGVAGETGLMDWRANVSGRTVIIGGDGYLDELGVQARIMRDFTPRTRGTLQVGYHDQNYSNVFGTGDNSDFRDGARADASLTVSHVFSPMFRGSLGVSYRDKMVDEDAFEDLFAYTFLGGAGSFSVFWQNGSYLSSNLIYRDYEYKGTRADEFWYSRVAYGVPITELTGDKAAWLDPVLVELAATRSDRSSNQTVFDFDSYGGEFRLIYRF
ncbi:hypothetical protein [Parvularcula marina]|uniref:hypothetical protein n=1 Tax=Parvularcula marina TaxID=2292771 RepID=UPI00351846DF